MKTFLKWNIRTAGAFILLMIITLMLTGRVVRDREENSAFGNTVYNGRSQTITYLNEADLSIETPRRWLRFFQDTKKGYRNHFEKYDISFLLTDEQWTYYMEVYIHNVTEGTSYAPQVDGFSVSTEPVSEALEINDLAFTKYTYARFEPYYNDYELVTDYVTVTNDNFVLFRCYYVAEEEFLPEDLLPDLDAKFLPIISEIQTGNATEGIREIPRKSFWELAKTFTFSLWILVIPLFYILFSGMKHKDSNYVPSAKDLQDLSRGKVTEEELYGAWQLNPLGLQNSKAVLGFFALLIVLHHLVQTIGAENASILACLEHFGVCLVGGFFFYSGYGLMKSKQNKPGYFKGFFRKRFPAILIPFYLCIIVFLATEFLSGQRYNVTEWLAYLSGWLLINSHMWYIVEIALLYTVFYLLFRFIKREHFAILGMFLFLCLLTAGSLLLGHGEYWFQGEWWYNSSLIFLLGILMAYREESILTFLKKHYVMLTVFFSLAYLVLTYVTSQMLLYHGYWTETPDNPQYYDKVITLLPQLGMTVFFVCLMVMISLKCRFDNTVLRFLGKISLELYLIHNLFINHLSAITGAGLYILAVLMCSVIAATLLHDISTFILCKINKKPFPKRKDLRPAIRNFFCEIKGKLQRWAHFVKHRPAKTLRLTLRHIFCIFLSVLSILPLYIVFINATRKDQRGIKFLPEGHFEDNYNTLLSMTAGLDCTFYEALFYSLVVALGSMFLAVYCGSLCAYGLEMYRFRGRKPLWKLITVALMFSPVGSSVGFFHLVLKLGLLNNLLPLILPAIATPSVAYFMRMYLRMIPLQSIVEAARIDGCREIGIFHRIILPAIKPALCLQLLFSFSAAWNNSYFHTLVLHMPHLRTISMYQGFGNSALLLIFTIPPIIILILFSKTLASQIVLGHVTE